MSDNDNVDDSSRQVKEETPTHDDKGVASAADGKFKDNNYSHDDHLVKDLIMWRRRKISALLLLVATVLWILLEVYRFNFAPIASWTAMGYISLLFLYGCVFRLLQKEIVDTSGWQVSEESVKEMIISATRVVERSIRWMFHISCEREWYTLAGVVTGLLLLGYVGHHFDMLTLLYIGTLMGMTVPVVYVKKQDDIKAYGERLRVQGDRLYSKLDEKLFSKLKSRVKKEKKSE